MLEMNEDDQLALAIEKMANCLKHHNFAMITYNGLQFSTYKAIVFGYILTQKIT